MDRDSLGRLLPGHHATPNAGRAPRNQELAYLLAARRGCPPEAMEDIARRLRAVAMGEVPAASIADQLAAARTLAKILVPPPVAGQAEGEPARKTDWGKLSLAELQTLLSLSVKARGGDGVVDVTPPQERG